MNLLKYRMIFLDLDGTLIKTASGKTFPETVYDFMPRQEVFAGLVKLADKGMLRHASIVTNQGGIEAGFVKDRQFKIKLRAIADVLETCLQTDSKAIGVTYTYCPSNDKANNFRKPNTGMLSSSLQFIKEQFKLEFDKPDMLMIGDMDSDKQCAENYGIDYCDVEDFIKYIDEQ